MTTDTSLCGFCLDLGVHSFSHRDSVRQASSAGLVWVRVGCSGRVDLGVEQTSVVDWLNVGARQNVGWSFHIGRNREWGHDHTITHAREARKGVIGKGHGPLVVDERGWRWSMDVVDRPGRDVVLGMG